jgi:hypothetical protein
MLARQVNTIVECTLWHDTCRSAGVDHNLRMTTCANDP